MKQMKNLFFFHNEDWSWFNASERSLSIDLSIINFDCIQCDIDFFSSPPDVCNRARTSEIVSNVPVLIRKKTKWLPIFFSFLFDHHQWNVHMLINNSSRSIRIYLSEWQSEWFAFGIRSMFALASLIIIYIITDNIRTFIEQTTMNYILLHRFHCCSCRYISLALQIFNIDFIDGFVRRSSI